MQASGFVKVFTNEESLNNQTYLNEVEGLQKALPSYNIKSL